MVVVEDAKGRYFDTIDMLDIFKPQMAKLAMSRGMLKHVVTMFVCLYEDVDIRIRLRSWGF